MSAPAPAFRHTNPDELDLMLRVSSPMGWLVLAVLACVVLGGLAWSVLGTAPIKVSGTGVLQGAGGVLLVSAPGSGPVSELKVAVGERVGAGDIVAVLSDPVLDARAQTISTRLAQLQDEQRKLAAFQAREKDVRARADAQRKEALENTVRQARERESALAQVLANQRDLLSRGFATRDRVLLTENDREQARRDAADAANAINALGVDADERSIRSEREMLELLARISQSQQELAEVEAERAARTLVRAPVGGRVIELSVALGDRVNAGSGLMRLVPEASAPAAGGLVAILYVPPGDGKKVRPGMPVQVVPSTVNMERDGFIRGDVIRVSEAPATREAVQQTLKNEAFVSRLLENGPPFEVQVALRRDPASASGYAWSSDLGASRPVEAGTVVSGNVVVERVRIITLVFPAFERLFHALGGGR